MFSSVAGQQRSFFSGNLLAFPLVCLVRLGVFALSCSASLGRRSIEVCAGPAADVLKFFGRGARPLLSLLAGHRGSLCGMGLRARRVSGAARLGSQAQIISVSIANGKSPVRSGLSVLRLYHAAAQQHRKHCSFHGGLGAAEGADRATYRRASRFGQA